MEFRLSCHWMMQGVVTVEAESREEAEQKAYSEEVGLPEDAAYIEDTFTVEGEECQ